MAFLTSGFFWRGKTVRAGLAACCLALATPLAAECQGENLLQQLPAADLADLRARAAEVPYPTGNFWHLTRQRAAGSQDIYLIGTYHLNDPRHDATLAAIAPVLGRVKSVLVEAGPEEQAAIRAMLGDDPARMLDLTGPTLPEALAPEDWQRLAAALRARGIPPFMAAKFRPWYLTMLLSVPACDLQRLAAGGGLDEQVIEMALDLNLPVVGLEPFDRVLDAFDQLPRADQLSMITTALAMEAQGEDMAVTLADAYFAGESRLIWEFLRHETLKLPGYAPERVNREFATMEAALMTGRNRDWIAVLLEAAARGPLLAAFGALHLSGDQGVLALLQAEGFVVESLPLE